MTNELKKKLDELNELLGQDYLTEEEYAIARANVFLEAGIDIIPRADPIDVPYIRSSPPRRRERRGCGCGCFTMLLLLALIAFGALFAIPEDVLKDLPAVGKLIEMEEFQKAHQSLMRFINDLRGIPESSADRIPDPSPGGSGGTEPPLATGVSQLPAAVPLPASSLDRPVQEGPQNASEDVQDSNLNP